MGEPERGVDTYTLIDPHGDLADEIVDSLPRSRTAMSSSSTRPIPTARSASTRSATLGIADFTLAA